MIAPSIYRGLLWVSPIDNQPVEVDKQAIHGFAQANSLDSFSYLIPFCIETWPH